MAKGSSRNTNQTDFFISNTNLKLKREVINIARNSGLTYSQWCRLQIIKAHSIASDLEKQDIDDEN